MRRQFLGQEEFRHPVIGLGKSSLTIELPLHQEYLPPKLNHIIHRQCKSILGIKHIRNGGQPPGIVQHGKGYKEAQADGVYGGRGYL